MTQHLWSCYRFRSTLGRFKCGPFQRRLTSQTGRASAEKRYNYQRDPLARVPRLTWLRHIKADASGPRISRKRPRWARKSSHEVQHLWSRLCLGRMRDGGCRGVLLCCLGPCDGGGPTSSQCVACQRRVRQFLHYGPCVWPIGEDRLFGELDRARRQGLLLFDPRLETGVPQEPRREYPEGTRVLPCQGSVGASRSYDSRNRGSRCKGPCQGVHRRRCERGG